MDDPRVMRALRLLIDHDEFIKAWAETQYGKGGYGSIFPTALSGWDLTDDEYRQHLEWKQPKDEAAKEAIALLSAAGFTKDNPLKFEVVDNNVPQIIPATSWCRRSGSAGVRESSMRRSSWSDAANLDEHPGGRDFFILVQRHSPIGVPEPDIWLTSAYRSGASLNFTRLQRSAARRDDRQAADHLRREAAQGRGEGDHSVLDRSLARNAGGNPIFPLRAKTAGENANPSIS